MAPKEESAAAATATAVTTVAGGPLCRPGLSPVVTPAVVSSSSSSSSGAVSSPPQRFVLLTRTERAVEVLSAVNGVAVCDLVVSSDDGGSSERGGGSIESLCVVEVAPIDDRDDVESDKDEGSDDDSSSTSSGSTDSGSEDDSTVDDSDSDESRDESRREYVVLAGLSDGTVVEWSLRSILNGGGSSASVPLGGRRSVSPRRISPAATDGRSVTRMVPSPLAAGVAYALVERETEAAGAATGLVRIEGLGGDDEDDDVNVVNLGAASGGKKTKVAPFELLVTLRGRSEVVVIAADPSGLTLFFDDGGDCAKNHVVTRRYPHGRNNGPTLTACAVPSVVGDDGAGDEVALGYSDGVLEVHMNLLAAATSAGQLRRQLSAGGSGVVVRSAHWHAHPLSALCYQSSPGGGGTDALLSGGEEAVLLAWDLSRGKGDAPLRKMPRLARGGIRRVCAAPGPEGEGGGTDLLVHCSDDTLQLLRGHDFVSRWRVQGLAALSADSATTAATTAPILAVCPRTNLPLLSSLPGSPGRVHWYDPHSGRVAGALEVAPYNRVSSRDAGDAPVPPPRVTHAAVSGGGDLITIDEVAVETGYTGGGLLGGGARGTGAATVTTSIKFWSWSPGGGVATVRRGREMDVPYELASAMPSPHGSGRAVCALAVSDDGTSAATLSPDEDGGGCLRIWGKRKAVANSAGQQQREIHPAPLWRCLRKIASPAGLSNALLAASGGGSGSQRQRQLLAFSPDGSVLAAAYGQHVALWDHERAALLTTLSGGDGDGDAVVRGVEFVRDGTDRVLTWSDGGVAVRAAFGGGGASPSWAYCVGGDASGAPAGMKKTTDGLRVAAAAALPGGREVAVALRRRIEAGGSKKKGRASEFETTVALVDAATGLPVSSSSPRLWTVGGTVAALRPALPCQNKTAPSAAGGGGDILALMDGGEMFRLGIGAEEAVATPSGETLVPGGQKMSAAEASMRSATKLDMATGAGKKKRRWRDTTEDSLTGDGGAKQRMLTLFLGSGEGDGGGSSAPPPPSADLPPLGGDVVRALVGSGLRRRRMGRAAPGGGQ